MHKFKAWIATLSEIGRKFWALSMLLQSSAGLCRASGINQEHVLVMNGMPTEERSAMYDLFLAMTEGDSHDEVEASGVYSGATLYGDGVFAMQALHQSAFAAPTNISRDILEKMNAAVFPEGCPKPYEVEMNRLKNDYNISQPASEQLPPSMFNAMIYASMRPDSPLWGTLKLHLEAEIPNGHGMGVSYTPSASHIFAKAHSYFLKHGHQLLKKKEKRDLVSKGAMSVQPEENDLSSNGEHKHENGVDPEDASIFWNQGERYSRTPANQIPAGERQRHRPSSGAHHHPKPHGRNEPEKKWQESPRKPSGANPMLAASKGRQRHNESATRMHKDICNRCGGKGHHSTICPSARKEAPAYGMAVEPLSETESEDASGEESPAARMLINSDSEDDMDNDIFTHCAFSVSNSSDDLSDICAAFNTTPAWTEHTDSEELLRNTLNLQGNSDSDDSSEQSRIPPS
jgi:hypothetical protein